ncbi:hypothetical protein [Nocardioides oleivorans]|uniref:hypothetical protein n=1 Tax=Nocardioides oleivorans TaxID=273676 RepID=UPI001A917A56|nr:hypothetical protein [Nocardioides oleivorans]
MVARHVAVLGGAAAATSTGVAGTRGVSRLGALLSGIATEGVEQTLNTLGLVRLVGQDRFLVLDELISFIGGNGDDLDAQAARDAGCDILDDLFGDADSWQELAGVGVTEAELHNLLERFLALYIYNRMPVVAERLSRLDPASQRQADHQMRDIIENLVGITVPSDVGSIDWEGAQGRAIAESAMKSAYDAISALDAGDRT